MSSQTKNRKPAVKIGDIFRIPAADGRSGFGQVIVNGEAIFIVIFEPLLPSDSDISHVAKCPILLVGWTLDALLYRGRWLVVGNANAVIDRVPFPSYKVEIRGRVHIHDFDNKRSRPATSEEIEILELKTIVSPIRYQNAFFAHHGLEKSTPEFEQLSLQHAQRRVLTV